MAMTDIRQAYNKIILVPTDFSDECRNAIYHAVRIAARKGFKVCILHVITKETRAELKKLHVRPEYVEWRLREYKKYYEKKYEVTVDTMAVEGNILTTINEVAAQLKAAFTILGAHGKKGLQYVFGSFARRVVLESPVPVVIVRKISYRERYRTIVFPVTGTVEPHSAVRWAKMIAGMLDAKFHLLLLPEKDGSLKDRLAAITGNVNSLFDREPTPDIVIAPGKAMNTAEEVIRYTLSRDADMIMIVNRLEEGASAFSLSSWNEKLMFNEAQIPVLCINPGYLGHHFT